ncbi:MAG TPA: ATP-binding protein [Thermoplasmatales archaeon]|nr:ATP-binding protein [Thermoplasmatales archaeon]HEX17154.1 ATP-binding protein [Thermoplasmatales archaeon]
MEAKHRLIVLSGKGGVGKSTISANISVILANKGYNVGLLDCDLHGPSIPKILGIENRRLMGKEDKILPFEIGKLKVVSLGMVLDRDSPVIWRGPLKMKALQQLLEQTEWGSLDYFIADLPPGTGDEPLSIVQLLKKVDGAIIVTTPQDVALQSVRRSISFARSLNVPILGIIENMSGFRCPYCGKTSYIFKQGGGERLAEEMGVRFLGRIPIDIRIVEEEDEGKILRNPDCLELFEEIVKKVEGILEG